MPERGAFSRRHLLGSGAAAGAGALLMPRAALAADAATGGSAPLATPAASSRLYPGITFSSGNTAGTSGLEYLAYDVQGAYPSAPGGFVGTALDVPPNSLILQVLFFLYQLDGQQRCDVQIFDPGSAAAPIVVSQASNPGTTGIQTVTALVNQVVSGAQAACAFVWGGGWGTGTHAACRGIRVDYVPALGTAGGNGFTPIAPARVYDSRSGGKPLPAGEQRAISVAASVDGRPVVPPGAVAVALTVTVTNTQGAGYVAVFPANATWSGTSSINWSEAGQNLATAVISGLDANRQIVVRGGVSPTDVVVDVAGYFS